MKALRKKETKFISVLIWSLVAIGAGALLFAACSGGETETIYLPGPEVQVPTPGPEVEVDGPRVTNMKVLRHPYRPSGQGAYVDLSGIMVEVTETDRNGTPKTYVTEDVNEFWTERIMSTYRLKDSDAIKGFPLYHKRGAPGVSATVIVPAVLPLINVTVGGSIPEVHEDDIDIKGDGVVITGVWETAQYIADGAVVTASGGSVYPFNAGALIPFPSGFPSVILDPAQGGVRLYGLTQDRTASGAGITASVATGGSYYLAPVDKIWMVSGAAVKAGTEPQFPRWHELNNIINTAAVPSTSKGWNDLFANSELTVTYYNLVRTTETKTRDINWNHFMAQEELYRMSKGVNVGGNTVTGGSIIFPDMTKGINGDFIKTGVNIYNVTSVTNGGAFIPPGGVGSNGIGGIVQQGASTLSLDTRVVDGVPVGNIIGYLRPRTEWPTEASNAMHIAVRRSGAAGVAGTATPGNALPDWGSTPVATGVIPVGSNQRSRADMSGLLLGRPVFGDIRDPLGTNPRVQFYYFGSLVTVPVPTLTLSSFDFVSRDANNTRPALTIRVSRAPTLVDWDDSNSEVNPYVVGRLIDSWYSVRGTFGTGDNSTTATLPRVMDDAGAQLRSNNANWNVNTENNILNPSRLIPTTPETGTAIAGTVQNWYTLTIPNDEQGNLVLPSQADFNAIQRGERLTFNVRVQFNLATPITGRATDPTYTVNTITTANEARGATANVDPNQRTAYWELPRPLVRTVTVTLVKDF